MHTQRDICKKLFFFWGGGVKPPLKKKQPTDFVEFLVCFFGHQSTPLSAIRLLLALFALFFFYLPTLL